MTDNAPRCQECGRRLEAWMVSDRDGLFCSQRCGGYLVAFVANQQDLLPSAVTCGSCGVEEPASRWITYAARARRLYGEVAA